MSVHVRVLSGDGDARLCTATPAARADEAVGDDPRHVAVVAYVETLSPEWHKPYVMAHDGERTPVNWWAALGLALIMGSAIVVVFTVAWTIGRVYGLNP